MFDHLPLDRHRHKSINLRNAISQVKADEVWLRLWCVELAGGFWLIWAFGLAVSGGGFGAFGGFSVFGFGWAFIIWIKVRASNRCSRRTN